MSDSKKNILLYLSVGMRIYILFYRLIRRFGQITGIEDCSGTGTDKLCAVSNPTIRYFGKKILEKGMQTFKCVESCLESRGAPDIRLAG
jgi:hypothetical protein